MAWGKRGSSVEEMLARGAIGLRCDGSPELSSMSDILAWTAVAHCSFVRCICIIKFFVFCFSGYERESSSSSRLEIAKMNISHQAIYPF